MNATTDPAPEEDTLKLKTPLFAAKSPAAAPLNQSRAEKLFLPVKEQCLKARELLAYLGLFLFIYSISYLLPFGFYDDYENLYHAETAGSGTVMVGPVQNARPILAYLYKLAFLVVRNLNDLRYLRLLCVIGIALCAWLVYRVLRQAGMNYWPAFLIPVVIFTLPAYQVFVSWSLSAFHPYAILLAGAALILTERALAAPFTKRFWLFLPLAALLELSSMMIYQPAAMTFLLFGAIVLFVQEHDVVDVLKRLGVYLGIIVVAIGLDDASLHVLPAIILGTNATDARTQLVQDIPGKINWFLTQPLKNALNLISITPSTRGGVLVGAFIVVGLLLYFKGSAASRLTKLVIALSLIPISYVPNLVTIVNFAAYRYLVAMGSLIALYCALAIIGFAGLLEYVSRRQIEYVSLQQIMSAVIAVSLALFAITAGVFAARNVATEFAVPQYVELTLLNSQLKPVMQQHPKVIYFVTSSTTDSAAPFVLYDEFGLPSSVKWWNADPMVYLTLQETDPADEHVQVRVITEDQIKDLPPGTIVIDMRKLKDER